MATSSSLLLADLALEWSFDRGDADLTIIDADIGVDAGIVTAVLLSLFLDRRAENDDRPPSGDITDRRGWWADEFLRVGGDRTGSRLWLLDRSKRTNEVALRAKEYCVEALAWMLEDRVCSSIDVTTEMTDRLLIVVGINRSGRDPITLRFSRVWAPPIT